MIKFYSILFPTKIEESQQEGLQRRLHSATRVKRETRILPIWAVPFGSSFTRTRSTPAKTLVPFDR